MADKKPEQEVCIVVSNSHQVEPSKVWEELNEEQQAKMLRLLTLIAQQYIIRREKPQSEEGKQSLSGNKS